MSNFLKSILILSLFGARFGWADTCPTPSSSIDPRVEVKVTFDKKSNQYTYAYYLTNGAAAKTAIESFYVVVSSSPPESHSPDKWFPDYLDSRSPPSLAWSTTYIKPGATGVGGGLPVAAYAVMPGQKLTGFSIKSYAPPGATRFLADGFYQPPTTTPTATDDEPAPTCPGIDLTNELEDTLVTGLTVGPLPPNTVSPKMRLRDVSGDRPCGPMDPAHSSGHVTLLILSSPTFDASQIDTASIKFGPAQAAPLGSKLVGSKDNDDRDEEREDWERIGEHSDKAEKKNGKLKNLLLTFDLKSLDMQCVLDRALFLNGSTRSGQHVVGGVSTRTIGCNLSHPGVHTHHLTKQREAPLRPARKSTYKGEK